MNLEIRDKLAQNASAQWDARGRAWIAQLPSIVEGCMLHWSLQSIGTPFSNAQYNFVAPAQRMDGRKTVLKIGFVHSTADDIAREITALTCYGGKGAVALIDHHAADGALLLARAHHGTPLADEQDEERATRVAARSMQMLWRATLAANRLTHVHTWEGGAYRSNQMRFHQRLIQP